GYERPAILVPAAAQPGKRTFSGRPLAGCCRSRGTHRCALIPRLAAAGTKRLLACWRYAQAVACLVEVEPSLAPRAGDGRSRGMRDRLGKRVAGRVDGARFRAARTRQGSDIGAVLDQRGKCR